MGRIQVEAPANGKVGKATIFVFGEDDKVRATDKADLMAAQELAKAAARLAPILGKKRAEVKKLLADCWLDALNCQRETATAAAKAGAAKPPEDEDVDAQAERLLAGMPADVRRMAEAELQRPDLFERVCNDVATLGVAGERPAVGALHLVGVSRLLKRPVAARVKGPSSSGKSYLIEQVARLFPGEAVILATQMTPQALFHMPAGSLSHRWIVAGERSLREDEDAAEATRALREMLASGRLSKLMPVKVGAEIVTQMVEQDGPVSYVESTTLQAVFDEDENRCISLFTDEHPDQTRLILNRVAADHAGVGAAVDREGIIHRHHAMQRLLRRREVIVPFATHLVGSIPEKRVEARRAFPHLLGMIQACALLHQYQRGQDAAGRVLAVQADYEIASRLLQEPMRRLLGGGMPLSARRFFDRLKGWFGMVEFTTTEARAKEETSRSSVYGWLGELHKVGALDQVQEGRPRKAAVWKLAVENLKEAEANVLPNAADVFG